MQIIQFQLYKQTNMIKVGTEFPDMNYEELSWDSITHKFKYPADLYQDYLWILLEFNILRNLNRARVNMLYAV